MRIIKFNLLLLLTMVLFASCTKNEITIKVYGNSASVDYGYAKLKSQLANQGTETLIASKYETPNLVIINGIKAAEKAELKDVFKLNVIQSESYQITQIRYNEEQTPAIIGADDRGTLYGIQDVIEQLRSGKTLSSLHEKNEEPRMDFRAIKFNTPWMSYRKAKSQSLHFETMRDTAFWESFLDMMSENRFNTLTLWNLHPFMHMIKPTNFPEAWEGTDAELAEWQTLYHTIFRMAKERSIDTYMVNWNIFVSPGLAKKHNLDDYSAKLGFLGKGQTNELIERYTRECVTQLINEYPNLTGMGITLGERMGGMTAEMRKDWVHNTIIQGIKDADREIRLLYRAPLSAGLSSHGTTSKSAEVITRKELDNLDLKEKVWVSFKYNWSHAHSSDKLSIVHGGKLTDTYWNPPSEKYDVVYTARNEDFFVLRWGQPDFIRRFIKNNYKTYVNGAIIGSESYYPAYDYISKQGPHKDWKYAFERQYLFYKMWGRLLYNPETSNEPFIQELTARYSKEVAPLLLDAYQSGSTYFNLFGSFYRGTWDATAYAEGFLGHMNGKAAHFIGIKDMIHHPVLDSSYVNIADWLNNKSAYTLNCTTPPMVARKALELANQTQNKIEAIKKLGNSNAQLDVELSDLQTLAYLNRYLSLKIEAGIALAEYDLSKKKPYLIVCESKLSEALSIWKQIVEEVERYHQEVIPYTFDENFSWRKQIKYAEKELKDIQILLVNI